MAEISIYSPRKVTSQNEKNLPSTHNPEQRKSYVQVFLEENEIVEAIRNYIRAVVPVSDADELPVVLTAGRGENGHTAAITIEPVPVTVQSVSKPINSMTTFEEVSDGAVKRNVENDVTSYQLPEPSVLLDAKITEEALPEKAINATEEPKKSSLFKAAAPVEAASEEPVAEICVAVEAEIEAPAEKPKAKSIFDNLN